MSLEQTGSSDPSACCFVSRRSVCQSVVSLPNCRFVRHIPSAASAVVLPRHCAERPRPFAWFARTAAQGSPARGLPSSEQSSLPHLALVALADSGEHRRRERKKRKGRIREREMSDRRTREWQIMAHTDAADTDAVIADKCNECSIGSSH